MDTLANKLRKIEDAMKNPNVINEVGGPSRERADAVARNAARRNIDRAHELFQLADWIEQTHIPAHIEATLWEMVLAYTNRR